MSALITQPPNPEWLLANPGWSEYRKIAYENAMSEWIHYAKIVAEIDDRQSKLRDQIRELDIEKNEPANRCSMAAGTAFAILKYGMIG